ncbi:MAG: 7-cyano-7-deazaguanine synthase [Bacteriovoracaceae bacterium]|jgi:predicted subunit of tRNA(5-methylaminomethyl-2-thiouridylate) methyltransferase|nr:7-cyano-7-deazaguanine synthase [Bacteriovoracaceae bacterium]
MSVNDEEILVLFSGGTDSTLAAALAASQFKKVHLITYSRYGIASVENSKLNAKMLIDKYGKNRVSHKIIKIDKIFKHISYENYLKNMFKYGFNNLSTCGLCKLSMHAMTLYYAKEHNIHHVSDGANAGMTMFPAQMKPVINLLKKMYADFGVNYSNPVFDYEAPEEASFINSENKGVLKSDLPSHEVLDQNEHKKKKSKTHTAGQVLYEMGLAPAPNVKGSKYDKARQPRCYQFILFNIFAIKYYLAKHSYDEYEKMTTHFFDQKIQMVRDLIANKEEKKNKKLFE